MELKGKVIEIFETQVVSDTFKKREFVLLVEDNPTYPEKIKMEVIQDKCSILDSYKVNDTVTAQINIKGRDWTNKEGIRNYFVTIQAWKIEKESIAEPHGHSDVDLPF